jgi:hypothetical protein
MHTYGTENAWSWLCDLMPAEALVLRIFCGLTLVDCNGATSVKKNFDYDINTTCTIIKYICV